MYFAFVVMYRYKMTCIIILCPITYKVHGEREREREREKEDGVEKKMLFINRDADEKVEIDR